jgi:hypothetical protein
MDKIATTRNLTALGIIMIVKALATAAEVTFDGDPATVIAWGPLADAIIMGAGLIFAKGASTTGPQSIGGKPIA